MNEISYYTIKIKTNKQISETNLVDKRSNPLAPLLKEIDVESGLHVQLVVGVVDLGEFVTDIGMIK